MRASTLRSLAVLFGLLVAEPAFSQQIFINELLASNSTGLTDEAGEHDDWAELFNPGPAPIDIGGMYVTDDLDEPTKWQIPTSEPAATTIPPGGFLILWFDEDTQQGVLHVDTKLSAGGEEIGLIAADGVTFIDAVTFGPQSTDVSYGRASDGASDFQFFVVPTPGASNQGAPGGDFAAAPVASVEGGFFSSNIEVELTSVTPGAAIRYTLDGSEPDANSALYGAPLQVDQTTTLRAGAFAAGMLPSPVTTHTYLFGPTHTFPVVALSFRDEDFFDPATGIYPNFTQDWERPVHVEFFETDGLPGFSLEATAEIHGTGSATLPQKSLKIEAKSNAGSGFFQHPVFPDLPFEEYKSFLLRNSGQDWMLTMFRDACVSSLAGDLSDLDDIIEQPRLHLQGFRPGVVYLNGEYWGIHNLREHMKENYIEQHFGLSENEIDLLDNEEVDEGDANAWNFLMQYLGANQFSEDASLQQLGEFMDLPHFLDYNAFNILIDNSDWPGNNYRRWRQRTNQARWRFLTFDLDFSFGLYTILPGNVLWNTGDASANSIARAMDPNSVDWPNTWWTTMPFRKAMENQRFRRDFVNRSADFLNVLFDPDRVNARIDEFAALYQPEIQQHFDRWSPGWNGWLDHVQVLRKFANDRPQHVRQHYVDFFGEINGTASVMLQVEPAQGGSIAFSTLTLDPDRLPWSGTYFTGVEIPVEARPAPGYVFAGWSNPGMGNSPTANFTMTADETLVAFFEQGSTASDAIVINEINYNSPDDPNSGDWVELFNPNTFGVDISGWVFEDESGGQFSIPGGTVLQAGGFLVLVENAAEFLAVYPLTTNILGNFGDGAGGFKLSNSSELISLKNASFEVIDSVRYDDENPWPGGADGTGLTLQLVSWTLDNALPASWKANLPTPGLPNQPPTVSQTIDFPAIGNKFVTAPPFAISATATSGLPVVFSIVSGPATLIGNVITLTGSLGVVVVKASQPGNNTWQPAPDVFQSFSVLSKPPYCDVFAERPWLEWIERVEFGSIDHLSFKTQYGNFTGVSTEVPLGETLALTITPAYSWEVFEEYFRAWIDFNLDGDFEDDGEMVLEATGNEEVTSNVVIPSDAFPGETRLRVMMRRGQWPEPCEDFVFGEIQDYTVVLTPDGNLLPPDGPEQGSRFSINPNPAISTVTVEFETKYAGPVQLTIVNALGLPVSTERFNLQEGRHLLELDVSKLPEGRYSLLVSPEKQRAMTEIFVKMKN